MQLAKSLQGRGYNPEGNPQLEGRLQSYTIFVRERLHNSSLGRRPVSLSNTRRIQPPDSINNGVITTNPFLLIFIKKQ